MKKKLLDSCMKLVTENNNYSQEQLDIIRYGLEAIYLTITKMIIIVIISYLLGILKEVFLLLISYNIIRSQAFGLHASKSIYCLISSLIAFVGGALVCKYVFIEKIMMIVFSIICNICLYVYAPADTHKKPLVNPKKRKRFKILSSLLGVIYTILIIIYNNSFIANYLFIGMILAVVMILPITYKVFKLPYDNYKSYEYGV